MIRALALASLCTVLGAQTAALLPIRGRVVDEGGKPLQGAIVGIGLAASRGAELGPVREAVTDGRGAFTLKGPPQKVGLTVTAPGHRPFFENLDLASGAPAPRAIQLMPGGVRLRGRVVAAAGRPMKALRVGFGAISNREGDQFYARVVKDTFDVTLEPGAYFARAEAQGQSTELKIDLEAAREDLRLPMTLDPTPAGPAVRRWIKTQGLPLATVEPDQGLADLRPLKALIGQAKVVGLGEGTHGTREFFRMKHRLFRYLVEELGFTALAFEANYAESQAINDYVLTGKGDAARAVQAMGFWVWDTEEVVDLVRWMRAYNADPRHASKVRFYGVDAQSDREALAQARAWLAQVAPEEAAALAAMARQAAELPWYFTGRVPPEKTAAWRALSAEVERLIRRLDGRREALVSASSEEAFTRQRQNLRTYAQWTATMGDDSDRPYRLRDAAMAENLRWVLDQERGGRVALWAHNGHLSFFPFDTYRVMGSFLKESLGKDYLPIGFLFRQGTFRAMPNRATWTVQPHPQGTLVDALSSAGSPLLALDLRALPKQGTVSTWFRAPQGFFNVGAYFNPANLPIDKVEIPAYCDALIFVESSHPSAQAWPLQAYRAHGGKRPEAPTSPGLVNPGFESGDLQGWTTEFDAEVKCEVTSDGIREGAHCLKATPLPGAAPGSWWKISQQLDATPFRGKRVRLSAWVRTEGDPDARIELSSSYYTFQRPYMELLEGRLKAVPEWTEIVSEGSVGENATTLGFSLTVRGRATAWVDGFKVEAIP
ncbi:MAG TPA: erythromycin esterase family protein [Holophagaceae bacterium]|nr:erythromycin esterase family protein [Holophagaceae bacterium]